MQLIDHEGLRRKGITFSRQHLHRLIKRGKFPAPVKIGDNRVAWIESEIDEFLEACVAKRDAKLEREEAAAA